MVISTSGYYSTGSSALFALLAEYSSCTQGVLKNWQIKSYGYEHLILYTPDGLFDLEDKLLIGNSIHRSDEAIRSFKAKMMKLYNNNYIWMGAFKELFGADWVKTVDEFIESITQFNVPSHWSEHYGNNKFNLKKFLGSIRRKIFNKQMIGDFSKVPSLEVDRNIYYSFVTKEEFYSAAQRFISSYFGFVKGEDSDKHLILNHFLLPHNGHRIPNYFDDDFRLVIVERDPRDVFVMEKYRTRSDHSAIPCDDVKEFVRFWKLLRNNEKRIDDERIIRIHFEDLMYKYEETIAYLEKTCNLSAKDHINKGKIFSVKKSILNTQLFKQGNKWDSEIEYIEQNLPEYLYSFPQDYEVPKVDQKLFGIIYGED